VFSLENRCVDCFQVDSLTWRQFLYDNEFYQSAKAAKILGVAVEQIHQYIDRGELKAYNLSLKDRPRWKIDEDDLKVFLQSRSNQAAKEQEVKARKARRVLKPAVKNYFS
jgi:hypothetical protein